MNIHGTFYETSFYGFGTEIRTRKTQFPTSWGGGSGHWKSAQVATVLRSWLLCLHSWWDQLPRVRTLLVICKCEGVRRGSGVAGVASKIRGKQCERGLPSKEKIRKNSARI